MYPMLTHTFSRHLALLMVATALILTTAAARAQDPNGGQGQWSAPQGDANAHAQQGQQSDQNAQPPTQQQPSASAPAAASNGSAPSPSPPAPAPQPSTSAPADGSNGPAPSTSAPAPAQQGQQPSTGQSQSGQQPQGGTPTQQPAAPQGQAPAGQQPQGGWPRRPLSKDLTIYSTETLICPELAAILAQMSPRERQQNQQNPLFRVGAVEQKLYVKGKQERLDFDNVAILYDQSDANTAAIIDPFAHVYSLLPLGDDDSDELLSDVPIVTNTQERQIIAGHSAVHYTIHGHTTMGKLTGDVWAAEDMPDIDAGFYDQSLSMKGLWSKIPGYVLYEDLAIYTDTGGNVKVIMREKSEVHSVINQDLPEEYFTLPGGFQRVPLGDNGMPYVPPPPKAPPVEDQTAT